MQTAKKLEVASLTDCHSSNRSSLGWKIFGPHRHVFCSPFSAVGSHDRPVFPLTRPVVVLMNALFKLFPKQVLRADPAVPKSMIAKQIGLRNIGNLPCRINLGKSSSKPCHGLCSLMTHFVRYKNGCEGWTPKVRAAQCVFFHKLPNGAAKRVIY